MRAIAEERVDMTSLDRHGSAVVGGSFLVGVAVGLLQLVVDADTTTTGSDVATANGVHVALALVVVAALVVAFRRDRRGCGRSSSGR